MHITIEISKATTKRLLLLIGALVVCLTAGIAYSALSVPTFNTGDTLNATSLTQLSTGITSLDARLSTVEGTVHPASAFHASLSIAQEIPTNLRTTVAFDQVEFDIAKEYDKATGIFTPTQAGVYLLTCTIEFAAAMTSDWYVTIRRNNKDYIGSEFTTLGTNGASPSVTVIGNLAANEPITCGAYQSTGGPLSLYLTSGSSRNSFSAARIN